MRLGGAYLTPPQAAMATSGPDPNSIAAATSAETRAIAPAARCIDGDDMTKGTALWCERATSYCIDGVPTVGAAPTR